MDELERQSQDSPEAQVQEASTQEAPPQRVTLEDVRDALEALGLTPFTASAGRIRDYLGRGSKETIQKLLGKLREGEQGKETKAALARLQRMMEPILEGLLAMAEREVRRSYEENLEERLDELREARREIEALQRALEGARLERHDLEVRLDEARRMNRELHDRAASLESQLNWKNLKVEMLEKDLEREKLTINALREQIEILAGQLSELKRQKAEGQSQAKASEETSASEAQVEEAQETQGIEEEGQEELPPLFGRREGRRRK